MLFVFVKSDKFNYANFYDIAKLNNFGLNPNNPIDSLRILQKNENIDKVNIFGALYGIWQIIKNYQTSIEELLNLEKPQQSNLKMSLTPHESEIMKKVQNMTSINLDVNCQNVQEYAETSDATLKCQTTVS